MNSVPQIAATTFAFSSVCFFFFAYFRCKSLVCVDTIFCTAESQIKVNKRSSLKEDETALLVYLLIYGCQTRTCWCIQSSCHGASTPPPSPRSSFTSDTSSQPSGMSSCIATTAQRLQFSMKT